MAEYLFGGWFMQEWLDGLGWSLDEIEVVLAILAAVGGVLTALKQYGFRRIWHDVGFAVGLAQRSYAAWFTETWGRYDNPYLLDFEDLDFRDTYVSLTFNGAEADTRVDADTVLSDRSAGNIVIEGDPGSGKSTLLRAYGASAVRIDGQVPFLVCLRRFANVMTVSGCSLAEYIVRDILVSGWGRSKNDAEIFLRRVLARDRAVILLDGLDEVPTGVQETIREAVSRFASDNDPQLPTARARLILTCRRQNFLALRERWSYVVKDGIYTLAPLRDAEILAYLRKMSGRFQDPQHGPEAFLHAIRASGTLELHRTPLILAMSVGLYAKRMVFEVPNEISDLYGQMITEMLERQAFKADPGTGLVRYPVADKTRLLREFATANAEGQAGCGEPFGEFPHEALVECAGELASRLDAVDDPAAFVEEIVERSGLVAEVGRGRCTFAHRSIQEYLVAEQLRQYDPNGVGKLLAQATESSWRQIVLFYTGTDRQSQEAVDDFLLRLADIDLALAGHCLVGAKATNPVAERLLSALVDRVDAGQEDVTICLAAMLAATRSPRKPIRDVAAFLVRRVLREIISRPDVFDLLGNDIDGVVQILEALAGTEAKNVADLVPKVAAAMQDDSRLVPPLWRCLAVEGIERFPGAVRIVERLLTLVMTAEGLAELERQEDHTPEFATRQLRETVYPFHRGHAHTSNLVTLLCWAEHLGVVPLSPNRFFEAKAADGTAFARAEIDRRHTQWISLHWPARIASSVGTVGSVAMLCFFLGTGGIHWVEDSAWLTLWWALVPMLLAPGAFFGMAAWAARQAPTSFVSQYLSAGAAPGTGRSGQGVAEILCRVLPSGRAQAFFLVSTVGYVLAPLPLFQLSPAVYLVVAVGANAVFGWAPLLRLFDQGTRLYLHRPNSFADMYDDARSLLWLEPQTAGYRPE